jgi:hypothetical protein
MSFKNFALKAVLAAAALGVAFPSHAADPVKIGVGIGSGTQRLEMSYGVIPNRGGSLQKRYESSGYRCR